MAIKLPCPRCKRPLMVPNKKAGGYVQCPQCSGRLWVPKDAPADAAHLEEVVVHGDGPTAAPPAGNSAAAKPATVAKTSVPLPPPASSDTLAKVLAPAAAPVAVPPQLATPPSASPAPSAPPSSRYGSSAPRVEPGRAAPHAEPSRVLPHSEPGRVGPEVGRHAPAPSVPQTPWAPAPATTSLAAPPSAPAAPAPPSTAAARAAPPVAASPVAPPVAATPVAPPQPSGRKVARFISAEAAQSTLKLADGKLPELHLEEGETKEKTEKKQRSVNPVVLVVGLGVSVVMSILLAVSDLGPGSDAGSETKAAARAQIRKVYYSDLDKAAAIKPYQQLLRDADLAHVRKDFAEERRLYRQVLDLLYAEGRAPGEGVTGSPARDRELERLISILLGRN